MANQVMSELRAFFTGTGAAKFIAIRRRFVRQQEKLDAAIDQMFEEERERIVRADQLVAEAHTIQKQRESAERMWVRLDEFLA